MPTRMKQFSSITPGNAPGAGSMLQGELAVNIPDKALWVGDDQGDPIALLAMDTFNVLAYGAAGDGVTDDTQAIQDAIDALEAAGGGCLFLPAGTYLVSDSFAIEDVPCRIYGCGIGMTTVNFDFPVPGDQDNHGFTFRRGFYSQIDSMTLVSNSTYEGDRFARLGTAAIFIESPSAGDYEWINQYADPSFLVRDIFVRGDSTLSGFNYAVATKDGRYGQVVRVRANGFLSQDTSIVLKDHIRGECFVILYGTNEPTGIVVRDCACQGFRVAVCVDESVSMVIVTNSIFLYNKNGVYVEDTANLAADAKLIVIGNIIESVHTGVRARLYNEVFIVSNEIAKLETGDTGAPQYMVSLQDATDMIVMGNLLRNTTLDPMEAYGIWVGTNVENASIIGNTVRDVLVGLTLHSTSTDNNFEGNTYKNCTTNYSDGSVTNHKPAGAISLFTKSATQTIAVWAGGDYGTQVSFDTEVTAEAGMTTLDDKQFEVSEGVEQLSVHVQLGFDAGTSGRMIAGIVKNNTDKVAALETAVVSGSTNTMLISTAILDVVAGDFFSVNVANADSGARDVVNNSDDPTGPDVWLQFVVHKKDD